MRFATYLIILIALLVDVTIRASGQDSNSIGSKIIDQQSNQPIPFATIRLRTAQGIRGLISNGDGDFQFPSSYRSFIDTVIISCIGYLNKVMLIDVLKDGQLNIITLKQAPIRLKEVSVRAKKIGQISGDEIVRA